MHVNQVTANHFKPQSPIPNSPTPSPIPNPIPTPSSNPLHTYSIWVSCGTWGTDVRRARMQRTLCDKQVHPLVQLGHWPVERLTMLVRHTANRRSPCQRIHMINCHNKPEPEPESESETQQRTELAETLLETVQISEEAIIKSAAKLTRR